MSDNEQIPELEGMEEFLYRQGYIALREIPGRGWCGVRRMMYTCGLMYDMDEVGIGGRYCYNTMAEAIAAIYAWNGVGDPPGDWIKHKGRSGDYPNPNAGQEEQ